MSSDELKNKPLVEAILEVRWELQPFESESNIRTDPHFSLLPGRFFDRVADRYPHHDELPS